MKICGLLFCLILFFLWIFVAAIPVKSGIDLHKLKSLRWYANSVKENVRNHINSYGQKGSRIIGGQTASRHNFPYQVALIIDYNTLCGGSLISVEYVLTSAHCVCEISHVLVILGAHDLSANEDLREFRSTASIHVHPSFSMSQYLNDIAVIKISSAVSLNNAIQIINMAPRTAGSYSGQTAVASGWGKTGNDSEISNVLSYVNLLIMKNDICHHTYGNLIRESHICSSGSSGGQMVGACEGDSGGPLVHHDEQIGIISFGNGCATGSPTVFTRVSSYRNWIAEITGI